MRKIILPLLASLLLSVPASAAATTLFATQVQMEGSNQCIKAKDNSWSLCWDGSTQLETVAGVQADYFDSPDQGDGFNKLEGFDNPTTDPAIGAGNKWMLHFKAGVPYFTSSAGSLLNVHAKGFRTYTFGDGTANNVDLTIDWPTTDAIFHGIEARRIVAQQDFTLIPDVCADITAATTIALPTPCNIFSTTGTTTITTVNSFGGSACNATSKGDWWVTLCKGGGGNAVTFEDGTGNLQLDGDFACSTGGALYTICDGNSWREVSRVPGGGAAGTSFADITGSTNTGQDMVVGNNSTITAAAGGLNQANGLNNVVACGSPDITLPTYFRGDTDDPGANQFVFDNNSGLTSVIMRWLTQSSDRMVLTAAGDLTVLGSVISSSGTFQGALSATHLTAGTIPAPVNILVAGNVQPTGSGQIQSTSGDSATAFFSTGFIEPARGGHGSAPAADSQVWVSTSTTAGGFRTLTDCNAAGQAVTYDVPTHTWGCASALVSNSFETITPTSGTPIVADAANDGATYTCTAPAVCTGTAGTDTIAWTWAGTSAQVANGVSDETGAASGSPLLVFNQAPSINAPVITGHPTIEGVVPTGATGTAKLVFDTTPTLVTPVLGVATATTINKVTITQPGTAATLTIPTGTTLTGSPTGGIAVTGSGLNGYGPILWGDPANLATDTGTFVCTQQGLTCVDVTVLVAGVDSDCATTQVAPFMALCK